MAPTWLQDGQKIDAKIDYFSDVSWNQFWVDFNGFWMPRWSQAGTKMGSNINVNIERRFFKKPRFFLQAKNNVFRDPIGPN